MDGGAVETATIAPAPSTTARSTTPSSTTAQPITKKIPYTGLPTENPNSTIIPGKMRSDREELPEGFTKEDADKAEVAEAAMLAKSRSSTARSAAASATNVIAAAAPTDCMFYWPELRYTVCGAIRVKYDSLGGPASFLLLPTSNELTNPDGHGKRNTFMNGPIYWSAASGAFPVVNHFMMKWGEHSWEAGYLGYPTSDEIVLLNGRKQEFQGGTIYWSPASLGAIGGAIRDRFNALGGETGPLGYPSSDELPVTKYNGRYNNFLNGTINWSGTTGTRVLYGAIRDRWAQLGREDGPLGYPLADEQTALGGVAHFADFEDKTSIWWTVVTGAHEVPESIGAAWKEIGAHLGNLGLPISAPEQPAPNSANITLLQKFQYGNVKLEGDLKAYVGTYDPTGDGVGEEDSAIASPSLSGISPMAIPPGATWPPSDVAASYPTGTIVGSTTNSNFPNYGEMVIRQGYWSGVWNDGWGQDKAEWKHGIKYVDTIEMLLESRFFGPRSDATLPGTDFWGRAMELDCQLGWTGKSCEEKQYRIAHAIYDPSPYTDYKLAPGAVNPVGVVTAYCGGGNTPLANTTMCDSWVDMALMNKVDGI